MKRTDLIRAIEAIPAELIRHGAKHDWYRNPLTGISQAVPRHREIKEYVARSILRMLSNTPPEGNRDRPGRAVERTGASVNRPSQCRCRQSAG